MLHRYLVIVFYALLLTLVACRPNANVQGKGVDYLQGDWQQRPEPVHQKLTNYTLYQYKFTCDSFYVTMQSFSKVNYGADTCMNKGRWTEYAKGRYEQLHDTLHVRGFFCKPDFKIKTEGSCFRSGVYEEFFKITSHTDSTLQFNSTADVVPVRLHLINRNTCTPKPL